MARVELTDDAKDDIRGLDESVKARVLNDLLKLETSPADRGVPLRSQTTSELSGLRKLCVGPGKAYRAVFAVAADEVIAVVMVVAARSEAECYELALARMRLLADAEQQSEMTRMLMTIIGSR